MRIFALFIVAFAATVAADTCLLNDLTLGNGLVLSPPFNTYNHDFICNALFSQSYTTVTVNPVELGASLKLTFNGNIITPFFANTPSPILNLNVGDNTIVVNVKCADCVIDYTIVCNRQPETGPSVQGDPQFVGLRGQTYQIHGVDGDIYNIISDANIQMNAKFVFLTTGQCPIIDGAKATNCWSHPGQYLGQIGIKTNAGERILLQGGAYNRGFAGVTVNNRELGIDQRVDLQNGFVMRNGTHGVSVQASAFLFYFENSDMFINQRTNVNDWTAINAHGLLGQTSTNKVYPTKIKYIEGTVDDYRVNDGIFGDAFVFNKFPKA